MPALVVAALSIAATGAAAQSLCVPPLRSLEADSRPADMPEVVWAGVREMCAPSATEGDISAALHALHELRASALVAAPLVLQVVPRNHAFLKGDSESGAARRIVATPVETAVDTLIDMGPGVLPAVTARLRDRDELVLLVAVRVVAHFGPAARAAIPDLVELLDLNARDDLAYGVQDAVMAALGAMGPDAAAPVIRYIRDARRDRVNRVAAGTVLGQIRPARLSDIERLLSARDPVARAAAVRAISGVGPLAARLVPRLARELESEDGIYRADVVRALAAIGAASKAAMPALSRLIEREPYGGTRDEACRLRQRLCPECPSCFR